VAKERPQCRIVATDVSPAALTIARHNAARFGLGNIEFVEGDWTVPLAGERFDLILSNPPYVCSDDPVLDALRFEPTIALTSGSDGLDAIRALARGCVSLLLPSGSLMLEHGAGQHGDVARILAVEGWTGIECFKDFAGHPRVTRAGIGEASTRQQYPQ
jgi:release factor glutamine methyltransferase